MRERHFDVVATTVQPDRESCDVLSSIRSLCVTLLRDPTAIQCSYMSLTNSVFISGSLTPDIRLLRSFRPRILLADLGSIPLPPPRATIHSRCRQDICLSQFGPISTITPSPSPSQEEENHHRPSSSPPRERTNVTRRVLNEAVTHPGGTRRTGKRGTEVGGYSHSTSHFSSQPCWGYWRHTRGRT